MANAGRYTLPIMQGGNRYAANTATVPSAASVMGSSPTNMQTSGNQAIGISATDPSEAYAGATGTGAAATGATGAGSNTAAQQAFLAQLVSGTLVPASQNGGITPGAAGTDIQNAMTQSGLFTPAQISAVMQQWQSSNNPAGGTLTDKGGGNTSAELSDWTAELNQGLNTAAQQGTSAASTNAASPTNNANPAAAAANPLQSITPATIQSQFPNGLPSYTASGVGSVPSVNAAMVDPGMSIAATEAYLNPQFQQQDQALTANLANAGIVGGTTGQAIGQLGQQQQTTLQNDIQPFLEAGALANQSAGLTAQQANQNAALTGGEFNANAQNQQSQFNIQNLLQTGQIDAATANQMTQYLMGLQNQDWLAQLGAQTNLATTAEGATTSAFNPVYTQPSATNLSGLSSAFGSNATGTSQPTNAYSSYQASNPTTIGGSTAGTNAGNAQQSYDTGVWS